MSYSSFASRWLGKVTNPDGFAGFQCVDLIKTYLSEEFKIAAGSWGNAIDYWKFTNQTLLKRFDRIATKTVKQGDIVPLTGTFYYYDRNGNKIYPGHIGIATGRQTATTVEILEQNGASGNGKGAGGDRIRTRYVAKSRMPGVLRPKAIAAAKPKPAPAKPKHPFQNLVGKNIKLVPKNGKWSVYKESDGSKLGELRDNGNLVYLVRGVSRFNNRVLVNSGTFGQGVALPLADSTGKVYKGEWRVL